MHTSSYVQQCEGPYPRNVGYWCYPSIAQSVGPCSGPSLKKDGGLRFCIDLRKLNNWTVKDAYSLPQIDKTLDSLQGSLWFSSLNLQSGYCQVKMDEESKPLTAFTVGLLGFYKCKRMPFGVTNTPATFQRLMETCLGGPQSPLVYHLSGWHSYLFQASGQPPQETRGCIQEIGKGRT